MLERVTAAEYVAAPGNGRTRPTHLVCEMPDGSTIELMTKLSAGCEQGVVHLARELVAACLAGDLGLPIPRPWLVEIPPAFADIIPDAERQAMFRASVPVAFGSTMITGQYGTWMAGTRITDAMVPTAAAIFTFDMIIGNADRAIGNANCLVRGDAIRIFDHELCFADVLLLPSLRPPPPWTLGALKLFETPGAHIFRTGLIGRTVDWSSIGERWRGLSDVRLSAYENAIPPEWAAAKMQISAALTLIRDARDHIEGCLTEIERVLT